MQDENVQEQYQEAYKQNLLNHQHSPLVIMPKKDEQYDGFEDEIKQENQDQNDNQQLSQQLNGTNIYTNHSEDHRQNQVSQEWVPPQIRQMKKQQQSNIDNSSNPQINQKSQRLQRNINDLIAYGYQKSAKRELMQQCKDVYEKNCVYDYRVFTNDKSNQIAGETRQQIPVEDQLIQKGSYSKRKVDQQLKYQNQGQKPQVGKKNFPRINDYVSENVFDRLSQNALQDRWKPQTPQMSSILSYKPSQPLSTRQAQSIKEDLTRRTIEKDYMSATLQLQRNYQQSVESMNKQYQIEQQISAQQLEKLNKLDITQSVQSMVNPLSSLQKILKTQQESNNEEDSEHEKNVSILSASEQYKNWTPCLSNKLYFMKQQQDKLFLEQKEEEAKQKYIEEQLEKERILQEESDKEESINKYASIEMNEDMSRKIHLNLRQQMEDLQQKKIRQQEREILKEQQKQQQPLEQQQYDGDEEYDEEEYAQSDVYEHERESIQQQEIQEEEGTENSDEYEEYEEEDDQKKMDDEKIQEQEQRNKQWLRRKELKLEKARGDQYEKEVQYCTFQPKLLYPKKKQQNNNNSKYSNLQTSMVSNKHNSSYSELNRKKLQFSQRQQKVM